MTRQQMIMARRLPIFNFPSTLYQPPPQSPFLAGSHHHLFPSMTWIFHPMIHRTTLRLPPALQRIPLMMPRLNLWYSKFPLNLTSVTTWIFYPTIHLMTLCLLPALRHVSLMLLWLTPSSSKKENWWFPFSMDREVLGLLDHGENSLDFGLFIIKSHFF